MSSTIPAADERRHDIDDQPASEQTPLLPPNTADSQNDLSQPQRDVSARRSLLSSLHNPSRSAGKRRWPSLLALLLLCLVVVLIIVFAFLAPSTVEQYAQQAVVFEPTGLSIDSFTAEGVRARVQGDFTMDARRVNKKAVRDLGKFFTYIAREAESGESEVEVLLPEYGNVVLGTAQVPGIKVDLRNGHTTHVDFLSDLQPGDIDRIKRIAHDWLDGRLGQLRVVGQASVPVKSGIFSLGKQNLQQEMLFAGNDVPSMPDYSIEKLNFHDAADGSGIAGMAADVALRVANDYPIDLTIPPLSFDILIPGCRQNDPFLPLGTAETPALHVRPKEPLELNVTGLVHQLPDPLTQDCPHTKSSPLDQLLATYIHGNDTTVYIRGSKATPDNTPDWLTTLLSDTTVPVPLPGRTLGHLIKNFTLADTHFSLPSPFADPDDEESNPRLSARVQALIALPREMNFNVSVGRVRADADVFYEGKKLGILDLHRWQKAKSKRVEEHGSSDDGPTLMVESLVKDAPLRITDDDVFADVIEALVFSGKGVKMTIKALVDVELTTALGEMVVRGIPAEGSVPVKPISDGPRHGGDGAGAPAFRPKVFDIQILDTTPTSLTLSALVNISNPTEYSASVPFIDIHILNNDTLLGHATARDLHLQRGENSHLYIEAVWEPLGVEGKKVGRELLSQYISGWNTSLTLRTHRGSLPTLPSLGEKLGKFEVVVPTPKLGGPPARRPPPDDGSPPTHPPGNGDGDGGEGGGPHFIEDATMHLFTSTATFTLLSPLRTSILYITSIDATAFYKGDSVGRIVYELPFAVPPIDEEGNGITSPRLPVDWSLGSVGYEAVKRALGGRLKLSAKADVGVKIGEWEERVWFRGRGIGASVRL